MTEEDPTAIEPGEFTDPSEAIVEEPPQGFVPQVELGDGQSSALVEHFPDLIVDAEDEFPEDQLLVDGKADDDDDAVEDGGDD